MSEHTGDRTRTASRPATPPTPRDVLRMLRLRALPGDRPYVLVFLAVLGLSLVIVSGPVQSWIEQRELVEQREAMLAILSAENDALGERADDLNDPATIEAEAREELGMYRPGEVPYVIVPPAIAERQITADLTDAQVEQRGWFSRVWEAVTGLFD